MSGAIPLLLLVACVAVALGTYALVRQARAAQRRRRLDDRDLYEAGEAAATERKKVRLPRLTALLHETGREGSAVGWIAQLAALAFVVFAVATALSGRAVVGAGAGAAVLGAMGARLHLLRKRRQELLSQQFTRVLPQVAASVRSSLTLERALRTAASHVEDPLREEVARVLADAAYGTTLAEAFELMAARTGDPDVRALAAAVRIQQRFGGAIAPVLDLIAQHAAARQRASRELKTELAGTRLAKWFVACSMPAIFFIMFATNADFAQFYTHEPLGWIVLGVALCSELLGLFACQRITSVDRSSS
ncbi:type II secretion system F family protein [Eggerthella sinensis]|uniref:type II secretion system F family protein n=1 Tax=Eggerthella sinensis TaxID=242230 RepID=UPI00266D4E73|nr:type II secretion system F family protein [Eggerthella sinensis]